MRLPQESIQGDASTQWLLIQIKSFSLHEIYFEVVSTDGFHGISAGKESTCKASDLALIPGSGRSPGEGIGYPLQYSWASLEAQMVKNVLQCGEPGFSPWVGNIPWEGHENTQYSCLENPHGQTMVGLQTIGSQRVRHD